MGKVSKIFKKVVSAVVKIVKVIVKVVKFVVNAVVNFVKGVLSGDVASIVMLVAIIFTFGAALGLLGPLLTIKMSTAIISTSFTLLASEYQREKAVKMQKQAEKDLEQRKQAAEEDLAMQAKAEEERVQNHFKEMEDERYRGYESGHFGIGSFEPDDVFPPEEEKDRSSKDSSSFGLALFSMLLGGSIAYKLSRGDSNG